MISLGRAFSREGLEHQRQLQRERARAQLETDVIMRHGWIEKIECISDEGLRIMLEEQPRKC
jgi:hypothetical protein